MSLSFVELRVFVKLKNSTSKCGEYKRLASVHLFNAKSFVNHTLKDS